jgi:hypothetical protein
VSGSVDLPPAAGVGGEFGGAPDADAGAGLQLRVPVGDLEHDRVDGGVGEAVLRLVRVPSGQVERGPVADGRVDHGQQRQVDIEGVGNAPGPEPGVGAADRLTGTAFEHELAGCGVVAGLGAGEGVQLQCLSSVRVGVAEGHPVGEVFELGAVEVHLELVPCLGVEGRFGVGSGDGRVDVHDEDRAVLAGEDVQVVEVELTGLAGERGVEVVGHGIVLSSCDAGWVGARQLRTAALVGRCPSITQSARIRIRDRPSPAP